MKLSSPANWSSSRRPLTLALSLGLLVSCDKPSSPDPTRLSMVQGDHQCGAPEVILKLPLEVRVLGPRSRDWLGRRGSRPPVGGGVVTFALESMREREEQLAENSEEDEPPAKPDDRLFPTLLRTADEKPDDEPRDPWRLKVTTDASGLARAWVRLGRKNGDWRVEASVERPDTGKLEKDHFRLVCGVERIDEVREAAVGEKVPIALKLVKWYDGAGNPVPVPDRRVFFRVVGQPYGTAEEATIRNVRARTEADGVRRHSEVTLGDRPGLYYVLAEVESAVSEADDPDDPVRGILFRIVAMDWYLVVAKLIAGGLLFLIGVRFLANGFLLILGPYLHFESGAWRESRVLGYLGGGLVGAIFQSWSTVASHLVSFANGGLLTARGGLMLLLGASLGATVLPQVLSLELSFLTIPLLTLGLVFFLLPRRKGLNSWGWVFLGGGLVLASWSLLVDGTELLSLSERFKTEVIPPSLDYTGPASSYFSLASSFFLVLLVGLASGFLLRTSNLLVILAILLASHQVFDVAMAIPLIIGANFGSALLLLARSSFKTREARRLATTGFVFHLLTTVLVSVLSFVPFQGTSLFLLLVDWLTPGYLFYPVPESAGHHVAMAHTLYNLIGGLIFLAWPRGLLGITNRLIPPRTVTEEIKPHKLDQQLIPVPALALRQATQEVVYLTELSQKSIAESFDSFRYGDLKLADHVVRREETISTIHTELTQYLLLVGENQLSRHDATNLEVLQTTAGALFRIGENAERLRDLTARRIEEKVEGSEDTDRELSEVYDLVIAQFDNTVTLVRRRDPRVEESSIKQMERLSKYRTRLEAYWRQRVEESESEGGTSVAVHLQTLIYQEAFDLLFRVASHLSHASQRMRILASE